VQPKNIFQNIFITILLFFNLTITQFCYGQKISAGSSHLGVVCIDGSVQNWGTNTDGQLGDGSFSSSNVPVTVQISDVVQIAYTDRLMSPNVGTTFAVKKDGTVWAWGSNCFGYFSDSTIINSIVPVQIPNISDVKAISVPSIASYSFVIALKNDGTLWAWGDNRTGVFGRGDTVSSSIPIQIPGINNVRQVSVSGRGFVVALLQDGTVWNWGGNFVNELGDCTQINRSTPGIVNGLNDILSVSAGLNHTLALCADGTVWSWGSNSNGQLGDGVTTGIHFPGHPTISDVKYIHAGWFTSYAIKEDDTMWAWGVNSDGLLGDGTTTSQQFPVQTLLHDVTEVSQGYLQTMALQKNGNLQTWGDNTSGFLGDGTLVSRIIPAIVPNICYIESSEKEYAHTVHGKIYFDSSYDCIYQNTESNITFTPLIASPGNIYGYSNSAGEYSIGLDDSLNYTITPLLSSTQNLLIDNICPPNYNVLLNTSDQADTSGFDFGTTGNYCHALSVDVVSSRKRICRKGQTIIYYRNEGSAPAFNVTVRVKFDQNDIPLTASRNFTIDAIDSSLIFYIDTLNINQSGSILINDSIKCSNDLNGTTQCTKAWILPINQCLIDSTTGSNWDHSSVVVSGRCISDTTSFKIKNVGLPMLSSSQYRIYADNILSQTGNFQLNSNDSLLIYVTSLGATIRLEADQAYGHPGTSLPRSTVEGCGRNVSGTFSVGFVNQATMDDIDLDVEIDCIEITGSFDPNDKLNSPLGMDLDHIVSPQTQMDYIVRFQNTGNDTAFTVLIIDTLSNDFDLSTLQIGASSHPFSFSLSGQGRPVLKFKFENILLPDSTTDEINSHGFLKYKISPLSSLPLGTRISNYADIFFDFNFPVRTNESFVTLGNINNISVEETIKPTNNITSYPNPFSESLTLISHNGTSIISVCLFSIEGQLLFTKLFDSQSSEINIELENLPTGCYFIKCKTKFSSDMIRIIKI